MNKLLERYSTVITAQIKDGRDESKVFDVMYEMYGHSDLLVKLGIEKLVTFGLIPPALVVKRICSLFKSSRIRRTQNHFPS